MVSPKPSTENTLNLRRIFKAPREKVFRAWTDPEELKKWWGPEGYATPSAEVDLRVGGKYRLGMRKLPDGETQVTVDFRQAGNSTEVVLTHEFFPTGKARDDHNRGWSSCLDRLAKLL